MRKPMMTLAVLMLAASAATATWAQNATLIGGELVAVDQFVHNPGELGFPEPHYHAASGGSVTALSGETFDDPAPFGEGFGQLIFAPLVAGEGLFRPNEGREVTALTGLSREGTDIGSGLAAGVDGLGPSVINVSFDASVALIMTPLVFFGAAYALPPVSGLPGRTKEKWTDLVRQANWQKVGGASPPERRSNRTTFLREPCVGSREGAGEASVAAWMGRAIEHRKSDGPGCRGFQIGRRQYRRRRFGEMSASPAVSENPCTFARLLLGPWEVFKPPRLS